MVMKQTAYHRKMQRELHSNADSHDENDSRHSAQLDADQAHKAKQLHHNHGQDHHLERQEQM